MNHDLVKAKLFFLNTSALYLGSLSDNSLHKHNALQICLGLSDPFKIKINDEWIQSNAIIIESNQPHQLIGADNGQLVLLLEPNEASAQQIQQQFLGKSSYMIFNIDLFSSVLKNIQSLFHQTIDCNLAASTIQQILHCIAPEISSVKPKDPRIIKVLSFINELEEKRISLSQICSFIALSESRLVHLFKEQTGVPVRRYLLWHRLMEAIRLVLKGSSLTTAAHDTGFSDSSHLSRAFKQMFGLTPNKILKNSQFIQVILCSL